MSIEKHISELLFEHDCVIISGFGGFVCNYSSAGLNPSKHQFHPPFKKISFNRNLKNNDGLLANQIVQAEGISYSEANRFISEYVDKLNAELKASKRFDLNNIGTFYLGEENTLLFEQDETVNYLQESFGLNTFYSPAIKREPIERKIEKKLKDKIIVPSKEQGTIVPAKKRTARYLAAAAVLVIAVLLWIPFQAGMLKNMDYSSLNPFGPKGTPLYNFSEAPLHGPDDDVTTDNVSNLLAVAAAKNDTLRYLNIVIGGGQIPIVVQLQDDAATPAPKESTRVKTKLRDKHTKNHFQIIGGAFAIAENAEKFVQKLKRLGYDAEIIDRKLQFVSYGSYATREEALQAIERIRAVQNDVWLMTN